MQVHHKHLESEGQVKLLLRFSRFCPTNSGDDVPSSPQDIDLFYSSLSKVMVSLVGQPLTLATPGPRAWGPTLRDMVQGMGDADLMQKPLYVLSAASHPTRERPVNVSEPARLLPGNQVPWSLQPEQLMLELARPGVMWGCTLI